MTTVRSFLFLGTVSLALVAVGAAPASYDQRQDGDFNLHAQLKNLLFVVAIPGNSHNDLLSDLALQALELKHQLTSRSGPSSSSSSSSSSKDHSSNATWSPAAYKAGDKEPYAVEIVQLSDGYDEDKATSNASVSPISENGQARVIQEAVARGATRKTRDLESAKSRVMPAILGYLVDARRPLGFGTESRGDRNVVKNAQHPDVEVEVGRPGVSLKKQLLRSADTKEENVAPPPARGEEKRQELRLLGNGIENCGPGRRRDPSGVCQFDESAASFS